MDENRSNEAEENKLIQERIKKLKEIRELGVEPYPYKYEQKDHAEELIKEFSKLKKKEKTKKTAQIAGRLMRFRQMGKASFGDIRDETGKVQVYFKQDVLGKEKYKFLKKIDLGDILGVKGIVFKTKTGELTLEVKDYELLCKAIRPLPEKFHGLKDPELRYRKRYLELIMNPEIKELFVKRTKIIDSIREALNKRNFLEVDTPVLQPIYGGANARPFKTHLNALDMDVFLRISNELYLKRLIVGGFEKVYEFSKDFRNEGIDKSHNPEFVNLELYQAYADYNDVMELTEELFLGAAKQVLGKETKIKFGDSTIDLKKPWKRMSMKEAVKKYAEIEIDKVEEKDFKDLIERHNLEIEGMVSRTKLLVALFEELVEEKLIQPVFITQHPIETTPLCKPDKKEEGYVERFELFIAGMEMANAYSELNDPVLQRKLLEGQAAELRAGAEEAHPMDEDFIESIEQGMPPTGGVGIGIDRLVMILTGKTSIREVIFFPFMRQEIRAEGVRAREEEKKKSKQGKGKKSEEKGELDKVRVEVSDKGFNPKISYKDAEKLVEENVSKKSQGHLRNVEKGMRGLARHFKQDEELWAITGLLHDLDIDKYKSMEEHTIIAEEILKKKGVAPELIETIKSHNECLGLPQDTLLKKALFACDELTGIISACVKIRPDKDIKKVKVSSVKKKFKDKSFARACKRENILSCEKELGLSLEEFIEIVLKAMQE